MADVRPFACYRPTAELAPEVAALPYDVYSRDEAACEIAEHPHSFLRIDKTAALLPLEVGEYDPQVYAKAAALLQADKSSGVFARDDQPCYYLYRLSQGSHVQTGIVAAIAVDDYRNNVVKRHENTRPVKLADREAHITALGAQTGPVFVTYRAQPTIDQAVSQATTAPPLYDFTAPDAVRHTVWRIDGAAVQTAIRSAFAAVEALYLADGHHRAAAAAAVSPSAVCHPADCDVAQHKLRRRIHEVDACGHVGVATSAPSRSAAFLAILFPANQVRILDYNRVILSLNGHTQAGFLAEVAKRFELTFAPTAPYRPQAQGTFGLYLAGAWYQLTIREQYRSADPVSGLDVALLQDNLLAPILGISDPSSSANIAYVGGARGLQELERRVDTGAAAAFALFPTTLDQLFAVADAGKLMPPKSTWFEPKPRSGLFVLPL